MSQKGQRTLRSGKMLAAAVAAAGLATQAKAALFTFDMKVLTGNPSVTTNNYNNQAKSRTSLTIGQVVTIDLWGVLSTGDDADPSNDGMHVVEGSFRSFVDSLKGDLGSPQTSSNRGVLTGVVQPGFVHTVDADTDLDVGDITYTGNPTGAPNASAWFGASSGTQALRGGSLAPTFGSGTMIDRIARIAFTVTAGSSSTSVNFVPRAVRDNGSSQELRQKFVVDDAEYSVDDLGSGKATGYFDTNDPSVSGGTLGNSTINVTGELAVGAPVVLNGPAAGPIPEPAGLGLLGIGAAAMLRRRARKA